MALFGFRAKCWSGWMDGVVGWMDTPQTVTTTRAPTVLKNRPQCFDSV